MLTRTQILTTERVMNDYMQKIHHTFLHSKESEAVRKEWEDTCRSFHRTTFPTDFLWSDEHRDKSRLRKLILDVAAGKNRREFRRFCSLAKNVTNEDFERTITQKAEANIVGNNGKFAYLYRFVVENR